MTAQPTLVIGDNSPAASRQLGETFQAAGFRVLASCPDGLGLAEAVLQHRPSLVVLDLVLPKLSGLQVVAALRRRGLAPTFAVASAVTARERVLAAKEAGAALYILKPFDPARLQEAAHRLAGNGERPAAPAAGD